MGTATAWGEYRNCVVMFQVSVKAAPQVSEEGSEDFQGYSLDTK